MPEFLRTTLSILSVLTIIFPQAASASVNDVNLRLNLIMLDKRIESVFLQTELTLNATSDYWAEGGRSELQVHLFSKKYEDLVDGLRAVLVMDPSGTLISDSYRYPTKALDLSGRSYFSAARAAELNSISIGKTSIGRSSGVPFIPVSLPVRPSSTFAGAVVGVVSPSSLMSTEFKRHCETCFSAVFRADGSLIAVHPAGTHVNGDFFESLRVQNAASSGFKIVRFNDFWARAHWKRNSRYPIISVYSEIVPN